MADDQQGATVTFASFSADVESINPSGFECGEIDITPLATTNYRAKMASTLVDCGTIDIVVQFAAGVTIPAMKASGTMLITLADGHTWSQSAIMTKFSPPEVVSRSEEMMTATMTLLMTGPPTCSWWA